METSKFGSSHTEADGVNGSGGKTDPDEVGT